ncbi:MAG: hypothetical protein ING26_03240 [Roseomonas sp.]|nr:hypothetical protein [Roseomonas sp.]MCA3299650.1 hypothetical protein [Roseomonas sp.]
MSDRLTSAATSQAILFSCYAAVQDDDPELFSVEVLFSRLSERASKTMISIVLDDLVRDQYLIYDPSYQTYAPKRKLLSYVEEALSRESISLSDKLKMLLGAQSASLAPADRGTQESEQEISTVPGSDRFVTKSDNIRLFEQAEQELETLIEAVRSTNDLQVSADERLAIISEVEGVRALVKQPAVRARAIYNAVRENGVLKWLAAMASAGVIGAKADAAINALLALLGL